MYPPVEVNGAANHKWKCIIGQCNLCPQYIIPEEETGTNWLEMKIVFYNWLEMEISNYNPT